MAKRFKADIALLCICGLLLLTGIFILGSVSASFSLQKTGTTFYFLGHQILVGLLPGLFFGTVAFFLPISFFKKWSFLLLLGNILLLILVFIPGIGAELGGAHRWLSIGPFSFQPSEPLKLTFILYMASWLAGKGKATRKTDATQHTFFPFLVIMSVISFLLMLQPDVGTLAVIAAIGLAMYFLAGTPVWHTLALMGVGFLSLLFLIIIEPYRWNRLAVFLNPSLDPLGRGYQIKQALIGIGSGGLTGTGLGLSFQKFGTLPEPISDSIFAVFAEEAGFMGSFLLIALFFAFTWRVFRIAKRVPDKFASLAAAGIGFWIFVQVSVNIGSMLGLLPLTGIPLPFISFGGSALATELLAVGILLNISKQAKSI